MRSPVTLLPSRRDYPRLGVSIFGVAWLIGNVALIIGFNGGDGEVPGICGFAIACVAWWGGYKLGGMKSRVGIVVGLLGVSMWALNLLGAMLFWFHH